MMDKTPLQNLLEQAGTLLDIKKDEIKATLQQKKGPLLMLAAFVIMTFISGNLVALGSRYKGISPLDFISLLSNKFQFFW